jgi:hypothetical protein
MIESKTNKSIVYLVFAVSTFILLGTALDTNTATAQSISIPQGFTFNRNLSQGQSVDPDIKYLQTLLNQDQRTMVSNTGAGSLTSPTTYFGPKTKDAVIRFQNLYASEVLAPAGLTTATGFVGQYTRSKLNAILAQIRQGTYSQQTSSLLNTNTSNQSTQNQTSTLIQSNQSQYNNFYAIKTNMGDTVFTLPPNELQRANSNLISISGFSTYLSAPGQLITIFGSGFTQNNTVYFGSVSITGVPSSSNGTNIQVNVPTGLPDGYYHISISNTNGLKTSGSLVLTVDRGIASGNQKPILYGLSPETSRYYNQSISIIGDNFKTFSSIVTNLGTIQNVIPTNSKRITFPIFRLPNYMEAFRMYNGQDVNLMIKVQDSTGISNEELKHVLTFSSSSVPEYTSSIDILNRHLEGISGGTFSTSTNQTSTSTSTNTNTGNGNNTESEETSSGGMTSQSPVVNFIMQTNDQLLDLMKQINPRARLLDELTGGRSDPRNMFGGGGGSSGGGGAGMLGGIAGGGGSGGGGGASAGGTGMATHFGGQITQVTYCTCSASILLGIQDIATNQNMQTMFYYGISTLRANYNIFTPGINVIGGVYPSGGSCLVYAGTSCSTEGTAQYTIDTLRGVGTALAPSI